MCHVCIILAPLNLFSLSAEKQMGFFFVVVLLYSFAHFLMPSLLNAVLLILMMYLSNGTVATSSIRCTDRFDTILMDSKPLPVPSETSASLQAAKPRLYC